MGSHFDFFLTCSKPEPRQMRGFPEYFFVAKVQSIRKDARYKCGTNGLPLMPGVIWIAAGVEAKQVHSPWTEGIRAAVQDVAAAIEYGR
jgi:hypothetical protein